jgi:predicted DNA-binding transcriptional regulator AlpA
MMKPLLNEHDVAQLLGVSVRTLQRQRVRGDGPRYVKLGKRVLYREQDIEAYVESRVRQSTSEAAFA